MSTCRPATALDIAHINFFPPPPPSFRYTRVSLANRYQQLLAYEDPSARRTDQQKAWKAHKEEHIIATPSQLVEVCNLILSSSKVAKEFRPLYKEYNNPCPPPPPVWSVV